MNSTKKHLLHDDAEYFFGYVEEDACTMDSPEVILWMCNICGEKLKKVVEEAE